MKSTRHPDFNWRPWPDDPPVGHGRYWISILVSESPRREKSVVAELVGLGVWMLDGKVVMGEVTAWDFLK